MVEDKIWISFILNDVSGAAEYYGEILKNDFDALVNGEFKKNLLKVEKLSWCDHSALSGLTLFSNYRTEDGADLGYSDYGYFKAALIIRILPVREDFIP